MRTKTIFIVIFTAIITIFLTINTDAVKFNFIFAEKEISKLVVIGVCTFVGFILGYWTGRPKTTISTYDKSDLREYPADRKNNLSNEDREYID